MWRSEDMDERGDATLWSEVKDAVDLPRSRTLWDERVCAGGMDIYAGAPDLKLLVDDGWRKLACEGGMLPVW
jgi:hypothetical protein